MIIEFVLKINKEFQIFNPDNKDVIYKSQVECQLSDTIIEELFFILILGKVVIMQDWREAAKRGCFSLQVSVDGVLFGNFIDGLDDGIERMDVLWYKGEWH